MITLSGVSKRYGRGAGATVVADNISARFRGGRSIALLGCNGAGKSSLLRIIAGTMDPDQGRVETSGRVSWPIGITGSFHGDLSGRQNIRFLARVYGVDAASMVDAVESFAQIGRHLRQPVKTYSAGMKARLAFGCAMAIPFDTYLVDEVTSVGDAGFKERSKTLFLDRMQRAGAIVVSHTLPLLREICDEAVVLSQGRITHYLDVEAAIDHHLSLIRNRPNPHHA
ncbi:ABC transporter ATP-binding protein [Shimia ponticola]|uniref:ABC transporter ATP-binding protein n=1 Tax=Shimia ponticola TaxID=2582893 RepID=UPI0011BD94A4|nr:ABC transporter ATP-binding protein [Shimia ponticola]